ncbi:hypothetical protein XELAEV_18003110mg, partial [Xenopus laevis]
SNRQAVWPFHSCILRHFKHSGFQSAMHALHFPTTLRMVGSMEMEGHPESSPNFLSDGSGERWTLVTLYDFRDTVATHNFGK